MVFASCLNWSSSVCVTAFRLPRERRGSWLRRARIEAPDVRPGTHGGTPYEIAARYAAGEIEQAVALRELTGWRYERTGETNPFPWVNDGAPMVEGSFNTQIGRALRDGFLADEDYDYLLDVLADD